jgi:amino acid transporter
MVAFMAVLVTYIVGQFGVSIPLWGQIAIAWSFSALVGFIAVRGINGSTTASIVINVVQLSALVVFSILAILFRFINPMHLPVESWYHPTASSIVIPHNLAGLLFQSTIAILILVGFESSTALASEAKDPRRDIPRGVILSLAIQGLFAYLLEYFATNYALSDLLAGKAADGSAGPAQRPAHRLRPAILLGDTFRAGTGLLTLVIAFTVAIAIRTTLAAMNTGVLDLLCAAQDKEMPELMGY